MVSADLRFLLGDCRELLPTLGEAALVLTDPPFGRTQHGWDRVIPPKEYFGAISHVVGKRTTVAVFSDLKLAVRLIPAAESIRPKLPFRYDIVWEKSKSTGFLNAEKAPLRSHELILVFYRKLGTYNPQHSTGHRPSNSATRRPHSIGKGYRDTKEVRAYEQGKTTRYPRSVVPFPIVDNDDAERRHPSQKPLGLLRYLVLTYTNPGDLVIDPCAGSFATAEACLLERRRFVGVEAAREHVEAAEAYFARRYGIGDLPPAPASPSEISRPSEQMPLRLFGSAG